MNRCLHLFSRLQKKTASLLLLAGFVIALGVLFVPADHIAFAQNATDTLGIAEFNDQTALGGADLRTVIARIINVFLGFLGVIAVGILLFAGFLWMTAAGNAEQVERAKRMIGQALIGLVIIIASWSIVTFIISRLSDATGTGQNNVEEQIDPENNCLGAACEPNGGGDPEDQCLADQDFFVVKSLSPNTTPEQNARTGHSNVVVRAVFNQPVNQAIAASDVINIFSGDIEIEPARSRFVSGRRVVEYFFNDPQVVCDVGEGEGKQSSCLNLGEFRFEVSENTRSQNGTRLTVENACGEFPRQATFANNVDEIDVLAPLVEDLQVNGRTLNEVGLEGMIVERGKRTEIATTIIDRRENQGGIGYTELIIQNVNNGDDRVVYAGGESVQDGSHGEHDFQYQFRIGNQTLVPARYVVTLNAHDLDGNVTVATSSFIVVGENCQNGVQDPGEEDVDAGGICLGMGACQENWQCASGRCEGGQCVASPIIEDILPAWNGAAGNYVTIVGKFFGNQPGQVFFETDLRSVNALAPQCPVIADLWTDTAVVVQVPSDFDLPLNTSSSIRLRRAVNLNEGEDPFEDTTINDVGPKPGPNNGYFIKNQTERPGICAITDRQNNRIATGAPADPIEVQGTSFGNNRGELLFGRIPGPVGIGEWRNTQIFSEVPNMNPERVFVSVIQGEEQSNGLPFTIQDPDAEVLPEILLIDPEATTPGSFITLSGRRFGAELGTVYLAPNAEQARDCVNNPNGCTILDAQVCGDGWSDQQIVAEIPVDANLNPGNYALVVRTQDGLQTDGEDRVEVLNGDPRPSICRITPAAGPAPLAPGANPLQIVGKNFGEESTVYFWTKGSTLLDPQTWLVSSRDRIEGQNVIQLNTEEEINTLIPKNAAGYSMQSGPIIVQDDEGLFSNGVRYTVSDCRVDIANYEAVNEGEHPLVADGYRCCSEGIDAGVWRDQGQICEGEDRSSGYVWRFTTGLIPQIPDVREDLECPANIVPSPSPWARRNDGGDEGVCLNAAITADFTLNMDGNTINEQTVRVYTCGEGDAPDCDYDDGDVTDQFEHRNNRPQDRNEVMLDALGPGARLQPNTWYRVTLSDQIRAKHQIPGAVDIEGLPIFSTEPLRVRDDIRNKPDGVAYYFDFKTGNVDGGVNGDGLCQLIGASVDPARFTSNYLGVLQDPRWPFDPFALEAVAHPLYYTVSGRADQACIILDVDQEPWNWGTDNEVFATAEKSVSEDHQNDRATVTALQDSLGEVVHIEAQVQKNGNDIVGQSDLFINLADPQVIDAWPRPDCQYSCSNASIGVRFNRRMVTSTYKNNGQQRLVLRECVNADCLNFTDKVIPLNDSLVDDQFLYQVDIADAGQVEAGRWYQASIEGVLAVARVVDGQQIAGDPIEPYRWKFRIKEDDPFCRIAQVQVHPNPFTAIYLGQKQRYTAIPISAPDQCSPVGQRLNAWGYGWSWSSANEQVATVSEFTSQGAPPNFCSASCLYRGSTISKEQYVLEAPGLCGNGDVDPGEDCDIARPGENPGVSCSLNCTRPGNSTPSCGDGNVEAFRGEECDPGGDKSSWVGCSQTCTNMGVDLPVLCGDGDLTRGEDCDGGQGCSDRCTNEGTLLGQSWCDLNAADPGLRDVIGNQCLFGNSVCGDNDLDRGEECEVIGNTLRIKQGNGVLNLNIGAEQANALCSSSCLLQNICNAPQIPSVNDGGVRCESGTEGCRADCHIAGASVNYSTPSICSDDIVGIGEYAECRVDALEEQIGQNPNQVVTAIGQADPNPETRAQETEIRLEAQRVRLPEVGIQNIIPAVSGVGDFALQCGYSEFIDVEEIAGAQGPQIVPDGDMERNNVNAWVNYVQPPVVVEKNREFIQDGAFGMLFAVDSNEGGEGIGQKSLPFIPGRRYRFSMTYRLDGAELIVRIGEQNNLDEDIVLALPPTNRETITQEFIAQENWAQEGHLTLRVPQGHRDLVNGELVKVSVDAVSITEIQDGGEFVSVQNDCPANDHNILGVSNNSCCAERPTRTDVYPQDGDSDICLNTVIEFSFGNFNGTTQPIDEQTLSENFLLAEGFVDPDHECVGEDVTERVELVLGQQGGGQRVGFFGRLWIGVKNFFARLFGMEVNAAVQIDNISVWCSGEVQVIPEISYDWNEEFTDVDSHVRLGLSNILNENKVYMAIAFGGLDGIKNGQGVSIRGVRSTNGQSFDNYDYFVFETGNDVCKLRSVTVDPAVQVFTAPNQTEDFRAIVQTTNGNQEIQPIENVYDWNWLWAPQNNQVFTIPVPPDQIDTRTTVIGSREVEGEVFASAQAIVTTDETSEPENPDNHTGRIFAGPTRLIADFCERPWPPRGEFPYSDDEFNFEMSYCADAGLSGITEDDLPYFDIDNAVDLNEFNINDDDELDNPPIDIIENALQRMLLFDRDNRTNDVLGIQILPNPNRLTASQWFDEQFALGSNNLQRLSIDGYDAVTDGSTYYVSALNEVFQGQNRVVYSNIYVLSINQNASAQTQNVLSQLIESLRFNTNMSDAGYCLAAQVDVDVDLVNRRIPLSTDPSIDAFAAEGITCSTDFDCRGFDGLALDGTNGICSNAKTKFKRDWRRLANIRQSQEQIERYRQQENGYPVLRSGTFVPLYTNSRWPSWSRLSSLVGSLPADELNTWSACGICSQRDADGNVVSCTADDQCLNGVECDPLDPNCTPVVDTCEIQDAQTCWDDSSANFVCPQSAQVVEYEAPNTENYTLYQPLEYFEVTENIVDEFVDIDHYSAARSCQPDELRSPFEGNCGDGVVNIGEQCDPPGSSELVNFTVDGEAQIQCGVGEKAVASCSNTCELEYSACEPVGICGNGVIDFGEICDDGGLNGRYGQCNVDCLGVNAAGACGNGVLDFDQNGAPLEYCEEVAGVCEYAVPGIGRVEQNLYFLVSRADALRDEDWSDLKDGIAGFSEEFAEEVQMGAMVFPQEDTCVVDTPNIALMDLYANQPNAIANYVDQGVFNQNRGRAGNPTPSALRRIREELLFNKSQDPKSDFRGKKIVLLMNSLPNCDVQGLSVIGDGAPGENGPEGRVIDETIQELQELLALGVQTQIVYFGDQRVIPRAFTQFAVAGGTNRVIFANSALEMYAQLQDFVSCSSYAHAENNSCALSCQAIGQFCGDNVVNGPEQCDDGNLENGDGCSRGCQIEQGEAAVALAGLCGDGIIQSPNAQGVPEVCDGGENNGVACDPVYDRSCSYCSADCREVLQVDSGAFCGNGQIDFIGPTNIQFEGQQREIGLYEACEVRNGTVIQSPLVAKIGTELLRPIDVDALALQLPLMLSGPLSCSNPDNEYYTYGEYSCSNDCREISNTCVTCGVVPLPAAEPKLAILNVVEDPDIPAEFRKWGGDTMHRWFSVQTTEEQFTRWSYHSVGFQYTQFRDVLIDTIVNGNPNADNERAQNPRGIVTNNQCSANYQVFFNADRLIDPSGDLDPNAVSSNELSELFQQNQIEPIEYTVNNEQAQVNHTMVLSPAVPRDVFRIVVRYDAADDDGTFGFFGNVFSERFNDDDVAAAGKRISYTDAMSTGRICRSIEIRDDVQWEFADGGKFHNSWMPNREICDQYEEDVYMHGIMDLNNQFAQATTLHTVIQTQNGEPVDIGNQPFAFFVGALANENQISLGADRFRRRNVRVEVYQYKPGQNNQFSVYRPTHVFRMNNAERSENAISRYWHPFNLVKDNNGNYQIVTTDPLNPQPVQVDQNRNAIENGSIETDYVDVLCNIPGQQCNRDQ